MNKTPDSDDRYDAEIRAAGLRVTRQRRVIMQVLSASNDHPDVPELHRRVCLQEASVSLATVYRTLAALTEKGVVQRLSFEGTGARFETNDTPHHDHIVDIESGAVTEFVSAEIERLQHDIARAHGYEIISHRLELYCRKAKT
ncbi:MAG: transcriptional repressor [Rhodobacteraceae bacterium]|nr:transcriptional repressor [Paracoccaceae bacterium]